MEKYVLLSLLLLAPVLATCKKNYFVSKKLIKKQPDHYSLILVTMNNPMHHGT